MAKNSTTRGTTQTRLRCRAGDIAFGSSASKTNPSRLVRVVRLYRPGELIEGREVITSGEPSWLVESLGAPFVYPDGHLSPYIVGADRILTPVRDEPGEDEMLRIAGHPTEVV